MLEKPDLADDLIIDCLQRDYGLRITTIEFLPLGADVNTAVYRAIASDATPYFMKLRGGDFNELTITVPHYLETQGISHLIRPIETRDGRLWTRIDRFAVILSPFITGQDGFTLHLTDRQWIELGETLKGVHSAKLPADIVDRLPRETYSSHWRDRVRTFQTRVGSTSFADPISAKLADLMRSEQDVVSRLVRRAEELATELQSRSLDFVVCHADIHGGNVLLDDSGKLYVVDWDTLILAPKERDLMFVGAGIGKGWNTPRESALFYRGYGATEIDAVALAYYRYERIVEDIAAYCEQILESDPDNKDRAQGFDFLSRQFLPNEVIDIAFTSDRTFPIE